MPFFFIYMQAVETENDIAVKMMLKKKCIEVSNEIFNIIAKNREIKILVDITNNIGIKKLKNYSKKLERLFILFRKK